MKRGDRTFNDAYRTLLQKALNCSTEKNARTGQEVRRVGPASFLVDLHGELPMNGMRATSPRIAAAEVAWFLSGERSIAELSERGARIWDKFAGPDGTVPYAYGFRWRHAHGVDQIDACVKMLRKDPSTRRAVVSAWSPAEDLKLDGGAPCPAMFTFSVRDGRLDSTLLLRSSDLAVGLPYDVMGHAMLMACMCASVTDKNEAVRPGAMQVSIADAHLYAIHDKTVSRMVNASPEVPSVPLQFFDALQLGAEKAERDRFVSAYAMAEKFCGCRQPISERLEAVL